MGWAELLLVFILQRIFQKVSYNAKDSLWLCPVWEQINSKKHLPRNDDEEGYSSYQD
jgi:hypothetical protein